MFKIQIKMNIKIQKIMTKYYLKNKIIEIEHIQIDKILVILNLKKTNKIIKYKKKELIIIRKIELSIIKKIDYCLIKNKK
jgi:hypothetical protein